MKCAVYICAAALFVPLAASADAVSGVRSSTAFNQTQGVDAVSSDARPGDTIQYKLVYENNTGSQQNAVIDIDLSDALYLSNLIDFGGAALQGAILTYESAAVGAGAKIERTFKLQVKNVPANAQDLTISTNFGNGIDVRVRPAGASAATVKGAYAAPKSGTGEQTAVVLAFFASAVAFIYSKQRRARISV